MCLLRLAFAWPTVDLAGLAGLKLSRCPHSFAAALAALPSISEIPFPRFRFDFVADFFRVRGCFRDFATLGFPLADVACCSPGMDAGFFRPASRCLSFLRK